MGCLIDGGPWRCSFREEKVLASRVKLPFEDDVFVHEVDVKSTSVFSRRFRQF